MSRYVKDTSPPRKARWDVPGRNRGQIVEVAYASGSRSEADEGALFQRVTDTSLPTDHPERVTYYVREDIAQRRTA